jgi:outer membrane protein TolC
MKLKKFGRAALAAMVLMSLGTASGYCETLSVDEAVAMALANNYDVKISAKDIEAAEQSLVSAKGANGISIGASSSLSYSDINKNGDDKGSSASLSLKLPLYTGKKNELTIENAEDEVLRSNLTFQRTLEDTELKTIEAYYDILAAKKIVAVDQETVDNYAAHLKDVQSLYSAGISPKVDVLRSEVELSDARQTLVKSQNTYDVAVNTLKNIIRYDKDAALEVEDYAPYVESGYDLADCLAYANLKRSDLKASQQKIAQAERNIGIAKSGKLPTVDLSVSNGWDDQLLFSDDNHSLRAGVSAQWNLFDSNVTNAAVKKAEIELEQAELEYDKLADSIDLDVRENYLSMREAEKRFTSTKLAISQAEEDYFIAREKFKVGQGTMLDIIDAQLALSTAKKNYIQAQYDYVTSKAKLENSMGMMRGGSNE